MKGKKKMNEFKHISNAHNCREKNYFKWFLKDSNLEVLILPFGGIYPKDRGNCKEVLAASGYHSISENTIDNVLLI